MFVSVTVHIITCSKRASEVNNFRRKAKKARETKELANILLSFSECGFTEVKLLRPGVDNLYEATLTLSEYRLRDTICQAERDYLSGPAAKKMCEILNQERQ